MRVFRLTFLLIVLCIVGCNPRYFEPGYVVIAQEDTLQGMVKDRRPQFSPKLYKQIRFKSAQGARKKLGPGEVLAYGRSGLHYQSIWIAEETALFNKSYYSQPGSGQRHFVQILVYAPPIKYYLWEYVDHQSGGFDYIPLFKLDGKPEMIRVTQGLLGLKKNKLSEFFYECPRLVEEIQSGRIKSAMEVVEAYSKLCGLSQK